MKQAITLTITEHENGYMICRTASDAETKAPAGRNEFYVAESPKRASEIVHDLLDWQEVLPRVHLKK